MECTLKDTMLLQSFQMDLRFISEVTFIHLFVQNKSLELPVFRNFFIKSQCRKRGIFMSHMKLISKVRGHSYIDFHGKVRHMTFWLYPHPPPSERHTKKWDLVLCNHPILPCHGSLFSLLVQHAPFTFCAAMLCWKAMASHT